MEMTVYKYSLVFVYKYSLAFDHTCTYWLLTFIIVLAGYTDNCVGFIMYQLMSVMSLAQLGYKLGIKQIQDMYYCLASVRQINGYRSTTRPF